MPSSARSWSLNRVQAVLLLVLLTAAAFVQPSLASKPNRLKGSVKDQKPSALAVKPATTETVTSQPPRDSLRSLEKWMKQRRAKTGKVPGWVKAYEFWYRQRAFPNDRMDWAAQKRAQAHADKMPRATRLGRNGSTREAPLQRWELAGPRNLGTPYRIYYGTGPLAGRISALAIDQNRRNVYWAAAGQGGVWKSTDYGNTWTCKSDSPIFKNQRIGTLTIDPTNSDVIYVGTGDFTGGNNAYGYGVLKSIDGGENWALMGGNTLDGQSIRKIRVLPEEPNTVLVTTGRDQYAFNGQVYLSTNGGGAWTPVITNRADWGDSVASARFNNGTGERFYYVCGNGPSGGEVWRSGDRCRTWSKLSPPLSRDGSNNLVTQQSLDLAVSPTDAGVVYLLSGTDRAVYKSTDSGQPGSWSNISAGFPNGPNNYNWSQHTYDWYITCSRNATVGKDVIYVGLIDLAASLDGGTTWNSVGKTYTNEALTHNDQHCLVVDPGNPDHCLVGNDGGVYDLTMNAGIGDWYFSSLNANLPITQFYHAAYHPTDGQRMLGGTQDNASPVATGDLYSWINRGGGDGGFSTFNTVDANIQYTNSQPNVVTDGSGNVTARQFTFYRSTDNWATAPGGLLSPQVADNIGFINPLAIAPSNPRFVYMAGTYLYQFDSQANTFSRLGGASPLRLCGAGSFIRYIAVAPNNPSVIYTGADDGAIAVTRDAGASWRRLDATLPDRSVTSIAVHPTNANDILISFSGTGAAHAWRCADTTISTPTWTSVSGSGSSGLSNDDPVNSIARDASAPDKVWFVGADTGLKFTFDGGANWYDAGSAIGLPRVQVNHVESVPGSGYLMAATWGRGIWRIKLSDAGGTGDIYEPDSVPGATRQLFAPANETHSLHIPTDADWSKVDLYEPSNLIVTAGHRSGAGELRLRVFSYNPANGNLTDVGGVTHANDGALYTGEQLPSGTYYFEVTEEGQNATVSEYVLDVQVRLGDSYEPDDSITEYTSVTLPSSTNHTFHSSDYAGDWVRFNAPAGGTVLIETYDLAGECDTVIEFRNTDGTLIDDDDDGGDVGLSSRIVWTVGTGGDFFVKVRPFNTARGSYKLRIEVPIPQSPTDFQLEAFAEDRAFIRFEDSSYTESGYELQRKQGSGTWGTIRSFASTDGGGWNHDDTGLTPGASYDYRIRTFNNNGQSFSPVKSLTMPGGGPPAPPAAVNAFAISDKSVGILITDGSQNETQFEAQISLNKTRWTNLPRVSGRSGTGGTILVIAPNLKAETIYYVRARSLNPQSGSGYAPSPPKKVKTLKAGKTVFNISPTLTINGRLGTDTTGTLRIPNPFNMPIQLNVPQIASPFSAYPTGNPYTLPATGDSFTVTFRPTSRTAVTKTWTITSVPPGAFTIKVKVVGKVP